MCLAHHYSAINVNIHGIRTEIHVSTLLEIRYSVRGEYFLNALAPALILFLQYSFNEFYNNFSGF